MTIDDYLPTFRNKPIYAKISAHDSAWVVLLEKAFAKVHGNYENIESDAHAEAWRFLTATPSQYYAMSNFNTTSITKILLDAYTKGWLMGVATKDGGDTTIGPLGLPLDHGYTIRKVIDYQLNATTIVKLF